MTVFNEESSLAGRGNGYRGRIISSRKGANKFYPVRIYDGEGNLKCEISAEQVRNDAVKEFDKGQHWNPNPPK